MAVGKTESSIWGNRNVVLLWAAQLVSLFGDYVFYMAIVWLALEVTGDNAAAGLVTMCVHLPMVVFSLLSGPLVDRWDRRRTMITSDAARCALLLLFPLLSGWGMLGVAAIAALGFTIESFTSIFLPARDVLVREITPREQLTGANALIQSAMPVAMVAGPAAAGLLLPLVGAEHLFTVDACTFAASLVLLLMMRPTAAGQKAAQQSRSLFREAGEGLRYAARDPVMRWLLLLTAVNNWFIMGPAIMGIPIFVREVVGGPHIVLGLKLDAAQIFAVLMSTYALGFIVASPLLRLFERYLSRIRLLLVGIFFDGLFMIPLMWLRDPLPIVAVTFIVGFAGPLIVVERTALIQEYVPERYQGRVFAMINLTVKGVTALSIAATGLISAFLPVHYLFGLWGAIAASLGPIGLMVPSLRAVGKTAAAGR